MFFFHFFYFFLFNLVRCFACIVIIFKPRNKKQLDSDSDSADDTSLVASASNIPLLQSIMNTEVEKVQEWLLANKLSVHYVKKVSTCSKIQT